MKTPATNLMVATAAMACLVKTTEVEAQQNERLSGRQKAIIPIAAFTGGGNIPSLDKALTEGMEAGLTVNEIEEILVHTHAHAGFPGALTGINADLTVMAGRKENGKADNEGKLTTPVPAGFDRNAHGHRVRNPLVGSDMSNRTNGYAAFAPVIDRFLVEHLFAEIFYRDVLTHQDRELATISILASMTGTEAQLKTHLRMCMNVGLSKTQLEEFLEVLRQKVSVENAARSAAVIDDLVGPGISSKQAKSSKVTKRGQSPKGAAGDFNGNVMVESRFASETPNSYRGAIVKFEAGARTAWHSHPLGQTLIVVSGRGLIQPDGDAVQEILPGDVVWTPPHERHWHDAAPDSPMSHVAISDPSLIQPSNGWSLSRTSNTGKNPSKSSNEHPIL